MENVKTILIDADDTVLDFAKAQHGSFFAACNKLGFSCTDEQYEDYDEINKKYWRMLERGEISKSRLIIARFEEFFAKYGIKADAEEMEDAYREFLGVQYHFVDGAEEGLKYLKSKYKIYVITNGIKDTQENRIEKSGFINYVDGVFISEAIGVEKPSKEFFDYVFDHSDAKRETSVVIGDSLTSDIKGGINADVRTIWFNGKRKSNDGKIIPDYVVYDWKGLKELL